MPESSRWETVERIYHQAVERPLAERDAFLESACAGDHALRRELESLLANEGPSFLEKSALGVAAREMDLTSSWIGRRIGGYEILALLGAGGMGEVYRARDISLGREVALKLLPREVARDPDRLNRLHREARLLASLNHHRIATLYGLEESDGQRFLVMELVPGQTLAERLRHGALRVPEALDLSRQIAEGLEAAHEAGIVHRDLKPANIKVTPEGRVKLLDFGLAKALAPSSGIEPTRLTDTATREGTVLGTAAYMSPEQARGQSVDRRTDIWAFGCCLYECLTGQNAFAGNTFTDTLAAILDRDPNWSALSDRVPPGTRRLLRRCLAKDVGKRLQHIGDARLELEETHDDPEQRSTRARWPAYAKLAMGAAALIAITAGLTSWLGGRRTTAPTDPTPVRLTLKLQSDNVPSPGLQVSGFFIPFALSPDGERLVFRSRNAKVSQLLVRELSGLEIKALPGTEIATSPFFSPDGRWIGFWRAEDRILRKVSVAGGSPIEIGPTDVPQSAIWDSDDEILFETAFPKAELWSIPASGGKPQQIVVRDRSEGERISLRARVPGGNDLLIASIGPAGSWLEVLSRKTGIRRRLLKGGSNVIARYTRTGHLVYSDGDALFAVPLDRRLEPVGVSVPVVHGIDHWYWHANVALSENGTLAYLPAERVREAELVWLDRQGNVTPVPGGRGSVTSAALSPDGREVAAEILEGTASQVWILDLERGTRRLLVAVGNSSSPIWSRDGAFITYVANREGAQALYRTRADGTGTEEYLVRLHAVDPSLTDWSPDGRSLLFSTFTDRGDQDIWIYSGGKVTPLIASPFSESSATFSPDGRFVAFEADDGGASHVYVQPFPGPGPRTTVSIEDGGSPRWAADGQQLFYRSNRRFMVVPVQTNPTLRIGQPQVLVDAGQSLNNFAVTPDGRRFMALSVRTADAPIELRIVLNWFEELKRLAPHP